MSSGKNISLTIGAFIVGAIALAFAALIFFSGGRLLAKKEHVVMYFVGSVQGLQVGAPVKLKGVVLGEVSDIQLNFQSDNKVITTPQTIVTKVDAELVMKRINLKGQTAKDEFFTDAINNGLRAQLNYQSFLTGLLYVELDFHPDVPVKMYKLQTEYSELPTMSTGFEALAKSLQEINIKGLVKNLEHMTTEVNKIVDSGLIQQSLTNFSNAAASVEKTSNSVNQLTADLQHTRQNADELFNQLNTQTPLLAQSLNNSMADFHHSLDQFNQAANSINATFSEDTPLMYQLTNTLEDVSRTARAFRNLSDTLEQQPEALLRGKSTSNPDKDH